jgi:rare lipoprotein A
MKRMSTTSHLLALILITGCAAASAQSRSVEPEIGIASFYESAFHGKTTASGRAYDEHALTAAHRTLPFGTRVRVTNLDNGRAAVLTITDRGPFARGRVIDVSRRAARKLGFWRRGTTRVRVDVVHD